MGDRGTDHFRGWFDAIMTFFFYIPNLAVAEFFIRAGTGKRAGKRDTPAALLLLAATAFVAVATWFFTVSPWGPGMAKGMSGMALLSTAPGDAKLAGRHRRAEPTPAARRGGEKGGG